MTPILLRPTAIVLAALMVPLANLEPSLAAETLTVPDTSQLEGNPSDGLIFIREEGQFSDLWRGRLSDGAVKQLTSTKKIAERRPSWSHAAQRLLYLARFEDQGLVKLQIQVMEMSSFTGVPLTPNPALVQLEPNWSPDGKQVAYSFTMAPARSVVSSGVAVFTSIGTNHTYLVDSGKSNLGLSQLSYSPDGQSLLMTATDKRNKEMRIWISTNGRRAHNLISFSGNDYSFPGFARDGKSIVLAGQLHDSDDRQILTAPIGITKKEQLQVLGASENVSDSFSPIPSPTRDEIVFVSNRDGNLDLFLVKLDRKVPINLTRGSKDDDHMPVWSPDGEKIAYRVRAIEPSDGSPGKPSRVRVIATDHG